MCKRIEKSKLTLQRTTKKYFLLINPPACNTKDQTHFELKEASHEIQFIKPMVKPSRCRTHLVPLDLAKLEVKELQHPHQGPDNNNIHVCFKNSSMQEPRFSSSAPSL